MKWCFTRYTVGKFWFLFLCLRVKHKSLFWVPILAAGGPYWVLISQKVGSLLGPYFKAWGSLLVWVTVHTFWKKLSLFGDIIILSFKMITLEGPRCTVDKSWQSAEPPPPSTPLRAFWSFGQAFPPWYASGKWNGGKWRWWTRAVDIGITPWFSLLTSLYYSSYTSYYLSCYGLSTNIYQ